MRKCKSRGGGVPSPKPTPVRVFLRGGWRLDSEFRRVQWLGKARKGKSGMMRRDSFCPWASGAASGAARDQ